MIKKTVTYKDYNDRERSEDLYFHLTKDQISSHMELEEEMEALMDLFDGGQRELTRKEVQRILDLVKKLIHLSYGERSDDGVKFYQSEEIFKEFQASAANDAFLWTLFQNPPEAIAFMNGIMPKDLVELAQAQELADAGNKGPKRPSDYLKKETPVKVPTVSANEEIALDDSAVEGSVDLEPADDQDAAKAARAEELRRELEALEA